LEVEKSSLPSRSSLLGFWALILIALVCLAGLAFPDFSYNYWTFPFVLVFIVALIGCNLSEKTRLARLFLIATGALVIGVFWALLHVPAVNLLTLLSLPLLIVAFSVAFRKLVQVLWQRSLRLIGRSLLHLAVIVLLIGVFLSAGAKTSRTVADVKLNTPIEVLQTELQIGNFRSGNSAGVIYSEQLGSIIPEYSFAEFDVRVLYLGRTYTGSLWAGFYPNYGLVLRPLILTTETGDIYLHLEYTDSLYNGLIQTLSGETTNLESVTVTVQTNPLVYLVWAGIALMILGISMQLIADLAHRKRMAQEKS
jgi:cytochrome c biogenesis factor